MSVAAESKFPVRNVEFEIGENVPLYWHNGRRAVSIFFNNLSTAFPDGEEFFIQSVKPYKNKVKDPQLVAEIMAFSGQEGIHTREHIRYNNWLKGLGFRRELTERNIRQSLKLPKLFGRRQKRLALAMTVAAEHWTSVLAHYVLSDDKILKGADPVMTGLWQWHAAEEMEHKGVAHDVFEQTGGSYGMRVAGQLAVTFWVIPRVLQNQVIMMADQGLATNWREWLDLGKFLVIDSKFIRRVAPLYAEYFKPDFHPWHIEDSHLIERWKLDYEHNPVYKKRIKKQPRVTPPIKRATLASNAVN